MIDEDKIDRINEWMDNPSQRSGGSHREQRHDPRAVSRALSGDGSSYDSTVLAVATVHKLYDAWESTKSRLRR